MEETIEINDKNGNRKKAQVILRLKDEKTNYYYIVYFVNGEYFAAKYDNIIGESKLDTNLTEEEIIALESIINEAKGE